MTTCVLYFYQLLGFNGYFCSLFFRLHIYKNHTENSQYTCQSCSQDFYDLKKFVLHQIKIHAERNGDHIYCLACRRPYTKSHGLVKYLRCHLRFFSKLGHQTAQYLNLVDSIRGNKNFFFRL